MERLQKVIAQANIASRRKAEELIVRGDITVNGEVVTALGTKVDPGKDVIAYKGKQLEFAVPIIYAFHKPVGVTSTVSDRHAEKTVSEFFPKRTRVYPVGRLDRMSKGLMLVTNDGPLAQELTHPSFEHEKQYEVTIKDKMRRTPEIAEKAIHGFAKSHILEGYETRPMKIVSSVSVRQGVWDVVLILKEGRNKQIRRIAMKLGFDVLALKRVRIGKLELGDLPAGRYKIIQRRDIL